MKKSKLINLMLMTSLLTSVSCSNQSDNYKIAKPHNLSDTTKTKTTHTHSGSSNGWFNYWLLSRTLNNNSGNSNSGVTHTSSSPSTSKGTVSRGGFGHSGGHVAS